MVSSVGGIAPRGLKDLPKIQDIGKDEGVGLGVTGWPSARRRLYFLAAAEILITRSTSFNRPLPSKMSRDIGPYSKWRWIMPLVSITYTCGRSNCTTRKYE